MLFWSATAWAGGYATGWLNCMLTWNMAFGWSGLLAHAAQL
jgi:hypothetical protein